MADTCDSNELSARPIWGFSVKRTFLTVMSDREISPVRMACREASV